MAGWRAVTLDKLLDKEHDLSVTRCQRMVHDVLAVVDLIWAALDCSTKSRARERLGWFADGRKMPSPLRSDEFPMGLPSLEGADKARVEADNAAAEFVLGEIRLHQSRGGASVRENPLNSIHWNTPSEKAMWKGGTWWDKKYAACSLQSARCKSQNLRHDIEEIRLWPNMDCHHTHDPAEWIPKLTPEGATYYPSKEEAEYTACFCFHAVRAASMWAMRSGRAKLRIPRQPPITTEGDRASWLRLDHRTFREWAMLPMGMSLGLDLKSAITASRKRAIPTREHINDRLRSKLPKDGIYVGAGHQSHGHQCTKWTSPFVEGQHGTEEECFLLYINHLHESGLIADITELEGKRLLCDCEENKQCVADTLIAEVYSALLEEARVDLPEQKEGRRIIGRRRIWGRPRS